MGHKYLTPKVSQKKIEDKKKWWGIREQEHTEEEKECSRLAGTKTISLANTPQTRELTSKKCGNGIRTYNRNKGKPQAGLEYKLLDQQTHPSLDS